MSRRKRNWLDSALLNRLTAICGDSVADRYLAERTAAGQALLQADARLPAFSQQIPLEIFGVGLPVELQSCTLELLRANSASVAERCLNGGRLFCSWRGSGRLLCFRSKHWEELRLKSADERWSWIEPGAWLQLQTIECEWTTLSFFTRREAALLFEHRSG